MVIASSCPAPDVNERARKVINLAQASNFDKRTTKCIIN